MEFSKRFSNFNPKEKNYETLVNSQKIGKYVINNVPNTEYVDPIEFHFKIGLDLSDAFTNMMYQMGKLNFKIDNLPKHEIPLLLHSYAVEKYLDSWKKEYNEIMRTVFPSDFFSFLNCRSKKKQEAILKKEKYDRNKLQAIFYRAWQDFGFTFSQYTFHHGPKVFDGRVFPDICVLQDDNSIYKVGETDLTDGELKTSILQGQHIMAKFLDNGKIWHCFFHTHKGLLGKEGTNNPAHLHCISSAFGNHISRESVLKQLQKKRYSFPTLTHLPFTQQFKFPKGSTISKD